VILIIHILVSSNFILLPLFGFQKYFAVKKILQWSLNTKPVTIFAKKICIQPFFFRSYFLSKLILFLKILKHFVGFSEIYLTLLKK